VVLHGKQLPEGLLHLKGGILGRKYTCAILVLQQVNFV
jgi:hypothetical protein